MKVKFAQPSSSLAIDSPLGPVPPEWPIVRLETVATKIKSGATPKGGEHAYLTERENFALIRSQNIYDRRFSADGLAFIADNQAAELAGAEVQERDILLNITGDGVTFARAAMIPAEVLPACVNQHVMIIRPDPNRCDPGFLLAYLTHPQIKSYMESFNAGGSRRAITKGHISSFEIPLPPIAEQRAIARVLGDLDDKIELNRRMNATLEAMVQALFQSWFVDFEPVRAKAAGLTPEGLDAATAALFSAEFVDSPLGEIPSGWTSGTIDSLARLIRETINPGYFPDEVFAHYSLPAFDEGRLPSADRGETILSQKGLLSAGCVLVSKLNPRFPRCWLPKVMPGFRAVASTEFLVLGPRPGFTCEFIYAKLTSASFNRDFATLVTGTSSSHQRVQPASLMAMQTIVPPESVITKFTHLVSPWLNEVERRRMESQRLVTLRDELLPQLLSGELRVPIVTVTTA